LEKRVFWETVPVFTFLARHLQNPNSEIKKNYLATEGTEITEKLKAEIVRNLATHNQKDLKDFVSILLF
jgi:hypothetical protein